MQSAQGHTGRAGDEGQGAASQHRTAGQGRATAVPRSPIPWPHILTVPMATFKGRLWSETSQNLIFSDVPGLPMASVVMREQRGVSKEERDHEMEGEAQSKAPPDLTLRCYLIESIFIQQLRFLGEWSNVKSNEILCYILI